MSAFGAMATADPVEAARRYEAAMAEAGYVPRAVVPNFDEPAFPIGAPRLYDDGGRKATWRAYFLLGRASLPCVDCYVAGSHVPVFTDGCEHQVVWA